MRDTIAFIATYDHPSRYSMEQMLREAFPEFSLEVISINSLVRERRDWLIPNLFAMLREYPEAALQGKAALRLSYYRTTYLLRHLRSAMRTLLDPRRHVFSFQTQSIYDTSVPGVPHFLYTDNTHLSNLASAWFDRGKMRPPAWIDLERGIYQNASLVFTRSHNVTRDLIELYHMPPERVACVHFGTNAKLAEHFTSANQGYSNQRILFIGRDWERKGGPELVQAFSEVRKTHPAAELVIVGAQPALSVPGCTVLGDVPIDKLSAQFSAASIFCVPSRHEPFGVVFLEAMMHRLPVVATRIAAIPDMVHEGITGRLVEPGNVPALANALSQLLADPVLCQRYGESGFAHATENYTWEKVGAKVRQRILPLLQR